MARGGKRQGSGRKPGVSSATLVRRKFQDYFTEEEVKKLIADVKRESKNKPELLKLIVEQLFGKAPQRMELTGKDGESLVVNLSTEIAQKNGINTSPEPNSQGPTSI